MQHSYSFEKLEVWKKAKELAVRLYAVTSLFPQEEKFGIVSQIAFGSLMEVLCQTTIANELEFLPNEDMADFRQRIDEVARMLNSLRKSQIGKVDF
jgi:hypothetical protein